MINKSKQSWLKWLKDNGAKEVHEVLCEFADQIHGFVDDRFCIAFFYPNNVTFTIFGETKEHVPIDEFEDKLKTLKQPRKEYTLERFELGENEYIKIESEIENGVSKTFYSLIKN